MMVEYAHEKNIRTCIDTNLNIELDESKANKLIKSGLDLLTVSLDGFSQKTYEKYRRIGSTVQWAFYDYLYFLSLNIP